MVARWVGPDPVPVRTRTGPDRTGVATPVGQDDVAAGGRCGHPARERARRTGLASTQLSLVPVLASGIGAAQGGDGKGATIPDP